MAYPLPDKPSIAILPFTNMSDDSQQEYFADGMTDDLITDLSKISGLFVIARNSTFTYKGKPVKVRQVAEELGVRYVLEGSVRRVGDQVRVNAQLIDATTGGHVWADRYDGNAADIFSLQDEFIRKIVKALAVNLSKDEQEEIALGQTSNIEAREVFQKGWESYLLYSADDNAASISQFEAALEIDPGYGRAYAALGLAYLRACQLEWNKPLKMSASEANRKAKMYLNETKSKPSSLANVAASGIHLYNNRHAKAVTEATRAIARDPNDPEAYIAMAWAMITTGNSEAGLELVERAMRLNPTYPNYYVLALGTAYFAMNDLEKAADVFGRALERDPGAIELTPSLAATYALLGQRDKARASLLLWKPGASQDEIQKIPTKYHFPYEWSEDREIQNRLIAGMHIAAMPLEVTLSGLIETLAHGNELERSGAIKMLRLFGPVAKPAIPALIEILITEEGLLRNEAVTTLGEFGPVAEAAIPFLEVLLEEEGRIGYQAAGALNKIEAR
jgi:TolB-like protein/Flp pilus assembly protein TadD